MWTFWKPLLRKLYSRLVPWWQRHIVSPAPEPTSATSAPAMRATRVADDATLPPSTDDSRSLALGGGWRMEPHPVPLFVSMTLPSGKAVTIIVREPNGWLLIAPNRRHAWVWPARRAGLTLLSPALN